MTEFSLRGSVERIELFPVPDREFGSGAEFRGYLAEHLHPEELSNEVTILVGLTKRSHSETLQALEHAGFATRRRLGAVEHLCSGSGEGQFEMYLSYEEGSGVVVFYTNFRKTEEIPQLNSFLYEDPKTYPLFFRPTVMQSILDNLFERFPTLQIVEFTARRHPGAWGPAKIRPEGKRTFSYWASDGRETLAELRFLYGVLPDRAIVELPDGAKFGIDSRGFLTFHRGRGTTVFEILGQAIVESQVTMKAYRGSAFQVFPFKTASKSFEIPSSTPIQIRLHRKLEYGEVEDLRALLDSEGYTVVNLSAEEGSLFLSADVISRAGQRFRIKASESALKVLPTAEPELNTFMEFYKFVVDSIDSEAELAT